MFPRTKLFHIAFSTSDHSILLLKVANSSLQKYRMPKLFHFEAMWLRDEGYSEIVQEAWERGEIMGSQWPITSYLEECQFALMLWNKNVFGHVGKRVTKIGRAHV